MLFFQMKSYTVSYNYVLSVVQTINCLKILKAMRGDVMRSARGGGPTLFLSVDFVNILPKKGGGQTLMSTKALTKF